MPLATPSEARAEFARNAGSEFPERQWLLTEWDTWERNPHYHGPDQRHPEEDPPWHTCSDAAYDRLIRPAVNLLMDSWHRRDQRLEREANTAYWETEQRKWEEATKIHRSPGCRCSDQQLTLVGCECMPW